MFRIDSNHSIYLTKGDSAQLDVRFFNKDWHIREYKEKKVKMPAISPITDIDGNVIYTSDPIYDSEGNLVVDSEGNPIDSEGNYIYPVYPVNSEGIPYQPYWDALITPPQDENGHIYPPHFFIPIRRHMWPRWRQIEEVIWPEDEVIFTVKDMNSGEVVLEKLNDEFPNTIFLDPEDTKDLQAKNYLYQLTLASPLDEEVNTSITGIFELVDKF
jgi:hypothetical protein